MNASDFSDDEGSEAFGTVWLSRQTIGYDIRSVRRNEPKFKHLLICCSFSAKGWERLGFLIGKNDHLEHIDLEFCDATDSDLQIFFKGAAKNSNIQELSLPWNRFRVDGFKSFIVKDFNILLRNSPNLTFLSIKRNKITTEGFDLLVE